MTEKNFDIEKHRPKGDGMTVPEGYFEDFAVKMAGRLPFREELDVPVEKSEKVVSSKWMRVRPYVYMAAMFAGAWCLLKMFSLMNTTSEELSLESYTVLSKAVQNDEFVDENVFTLSPNDVYFDLYEDGYVEIPDDLDSVEIGATYHLPAEPIAERTDE